MTGGGRKRTSRPGGSGGKGIDNAIAFEGRTRDGEVFAKGVRYQTPYLAVWEDRVEVTNGHYAIIYSDTGKPAADEFPTIRMRNKWLQGVAAKEVSQAEIDRLAGEGA